MYRYLGCGLDNVQLRNGYEVVRTASGLEVVAVQDVKGLHAAIATYLCEANRPLTGKEFRFLRKELDFSQRQIALMVGVEEQTISLWERDQSPINAAAERILRSLVMESLSGDAELRALLERFSALDREIRADTIEFESAPEWRLAA